jgi:hypothetical protein
MTTKPKTRKVPAAKATPKEAVSGVKHEVSEISRLVSRWRWLEEDQIYQAAVAETIEENERLVAIHENELKKIEAKLAVLVPVDSYDACTLLKFATERVDQGHDRGDGTVVSMLTNIQEGLRAARDEERMAACEELKAERAKGFAEAHRSVRSMLEAVLIR